MAGAPASADVSSPSSSLLAGASDSDSPRTFSVSLPEGWLGVDLAPAGLRELSARLNSTWPTVSQGLDAVADGGSSPFLPNTTFLAYDLRTDDLDQYPTGFNVAEGAAGDISCSALDLEAAYRSLGMLDVRLEYLDLPVGRVARVSGRVAGGPQDLFGATYIVRTDGRGYEPYFETLWDLRAKFQPVFDGIVGSFRVTVPGPLQSSASDVPFTEFPHDAPALEARMPHEALGRPLCTWSVNGAAIWPMVGADQQALESILKDLGLTENALTLAVAGRVNLDDPPFIVYAYEYSGANPESLLAEFSNWPGETLHVGAKTVFVTEGPDSPGHAEGRDYYYPTGNVIYWVKAADERWFEDVLRQLP